MKTSTKDPRWVGKPVVDVDGDPVGTLRATAGGDDWPDQVLVALDRDGGRVVAVDADDVTLERRAIRLGVAGAALRDAPEVDLDDDHDALRDDVVRDEGPVEMVRSEEELVPHVVTRVAERAVARKVVTEEEVTLTVVLRREDVVIDRADLAPDDDADASLPEDYFEEPDPATVELLLYAEQPVVTKRVVPVERVRVSKGTVTEEVDVSGEVQVERVEVIGADDAADRGGDYATEA